MSVTFTVAKVPTGMNAGVSMIPWEWLDVRAALHCSDRPQEFQIENGIE